MRACGCDFPNSPECECDVSCEHCWPEFAEDATEQQTDSSTSVEIHAPIEETTKGART